MLEKSGFEGFDFFEKNIEVKFDFYCDNNLQ